MFLQRLRQITKNLSQDTLSTQHIMKEFYMPSGACLRLRFTTDVDRYFSTRNVQDLVFNKYL